MRFDFEPRLVLLRAFATGLAVGVLGACSSGPPTLPNVATETPPQWQAPLPHGGRLAALDTWWQQFDDPVLVRLIDAAQAVSPSLAAAASRIEQARAARVAAGAALQPTLDANASASRGRQAFITGLGNTASVGVQSAWELDLFGGLGDARDAAQARLEGAQAAWHDARVAVAAEVATDYTGLRACEAQVEQAGADRASRRETARLTELNLKAGFEAPANAALARASAAQSNNALTQRRAQCDVLVKGLVALTGLAEPALRQQLAPGRAQLPRPAQIEVASVPAQVLAQRPDLRSAERELVAAAAEVSQAQAQRYPRITLAGNIGAARFESSLGNLSGTLWSIGPVTVALPLFDGGARRANVVAAQARYEAAAADYRGKLRTAVREVEEALIALQSTAERSSDAQVASDGFESSFRATQARFKGGLASLFELEDARRSALQAQVALIDLQRERDSAWISLYRALGGGWSATEAPAAAPAPRS
ncbi:MAG: efflux transporter outer membrane subunit [Burkholderiales bacterium]|nr:efflux transporter outer membrane subunit [Burkholderiales bacterium]MDE2627514.1 efflux transporter outer membrane subunit [Burkholderiales bacterium]